MSNTAFHLASGIAANLREAAIYDIQAEADIPSFLYGSDFPVILRNCDEPVQGHAIWCKDPQNTANHTCRTHWVIYDGTDEAPVSGIGGISLQKRTDGHVTIGITWNLANGDKLDIPAFTHLIYRTLATITFDRAVQGLFTA